MPPFMVAEMVIPAEVRPVAGIDQGDLVEVRPEGDGRIVLLWSECGSRTKHSKNLASKGHSRRRIDPTFHFQRAGKKTFERAVKYLLDVNLLIAAIWRIVPSHPRADAWTRDREWRFVPSSNLDSCASARIRRDFTRICEVRAGFCRIFYPSMTSSLCPATWRHWNRRLETATR